MASLKQMTRTRDVKLGHYIGEFATPGIGHIVKQAGCDFAFLDMEHSGFGYETVKSTLRYLEAADVPTFVRIPAGDYHFVARICDAGAEGVMVPMVGTAEQAKAIVRSMKYTPLGARGVALGIAHDNYVSQPAVAAMTAANERTTLFCLIETAEGVANADAIAAVDGVDCLWMGHFDLSSSLGIPGEFTNPRFIEAVAAIGAAARRHGKSFGRLVGTPEEGIAVIRDGFDFCCYGGDMWLLRDALTAGIRTIRSGARQ